jgi:hypothetical protein
MAVYQGQSGSNKVNDTARKYQQQREMAKTRQIGVSPSQYEKSKMQGMSFPFPMGGGGSGDMSRLAQEEYDRQIALMDKAAEMGAGYSSDNTLGTTDIDYENKMITERLSPELQSQYDTLLKQSGGAGDRIAAMDGDPYKLQMYLYNQNKALRQDEADDLRNATMESLRAKGMLGSTGGSDLYGSVEDSIAQADTQAFNDAFAQSQSLYDMERNRQTGDIGTAMAMGLKQIPYIQAGTTQGQAIPIKNIAGVSGASQNIFGVESGLSMGKAKQKKGIWDSLLGDGGLLGGLGLF